jgi:hypothetical protein
VTTTEIAGKFEYANDLTLEKWHLFNSACIFLPFSFFLSCSASHAGSCQGLSFSALAEGTLVVQPVPTTATIRANMISLIDFNVASIIETACMIL